VRTPMESGLGLGKNRTKSATAGPDCRPSLQTEPGPSAAQNRARANPAEIREINAGLRGGLTTAIYGTRNILPEYGSFTFWPAVYPVTST